MNMTLGQYVRRLRTNPERPGKALSQLELARRAGIIDSLVSNCEAGKPIRFKTLRAICQRGLNVSPKDWAKLKVLWLENQSAEPAGPELTDALASLNAATVKAKRNFLQRVQATLIPQLSHIDCENLSDELLRVLGDQRRLSALKQFNALHDAFRE
jgi:DNA-binding Xre family transcriptional regulator